MWGKNGIRHKIWMRTIRNHISNLGTEMKTRGPFKFLEDKYAPMLRIIMKYFTCEGRFSRLYTYHIRILMHFTRVKMLRIPYFLLRNIDQFCFKILENAQGACTHHLEYKNANHSLIGCPQVKRSSIETKFMCQILANSSKGKNSSKIAQNLCKIPPLIIFISKGSFREQPKPIILLFSFEFLFQPSFHSLDPYVENLVPGPVMASHVPHDLIVPIDLLEKLIKMKIDPLKPNFSILLNFLLKFFVLQSRQSVFLPLELLIFPCQFASFI